METIEERPNQMITDIEKLASEILAIFPELEPDSQKTAVQLYRLLGKGNVVSREELAHAAGLSVERINEILENWVGVFYEEDQIIGFWGLTPRPFSKHLFKVNGQTEYAWCAWDSLFLPEILRETAEVESTDPETGEIIRLTITPEGVTHIEPEGAVMSMVEPKEEMTEDIVSNFCHLVHFFPSAEVGKKWTAKNPGTSLISIEDAFELGKKRNHGQFKEALQMAVN